MSFQHQGGPLDGLGLETAALILRLQLEDTEQLAGDYHNGEHQRDNELAMRMTRDELLYFANRIEHQVHARAIENGTAPGITGHVAPEASKLECLICAEELPNQDIVVLPCDHNWCKACVRETFRKATIDEDMFPPKCCDEISLTVINGILDPALVVTFRARFIEFTTADRTYCANNQCSAFLPPAETNGAESVACPSCGTLTCTICKAVSHGVEDCPEDHEARRLRELATREGWQRCPSCRRTVELISGCYHIRCPCGTDFCYVCQVLWEEPKTCPCPLWEEDNILIRQERVPRRARNPLPVHIRAQPFIEQQILEARNHLVLREHPADPDRGLEPHAQERIRLLVQQQLAIMPINILPLEEPLVQQRVVNEPINPGPAPAPVEVVRDQAEQQLGRQECRHRSFRHIRTDRGPDLKCGMCGVPTPEFGYRCKDCSSLLCRRCKQRQRR